MLRLDSDLDPDSAKNTGARDNAKALDIAQAIETACLTLVEKITSIELHNKETICCVLATD
jgi:hypothetical protein